MSDILRRLTKIALINSANMPCCEVNLEGNVHFMGDQGAGKTTLLRALMFFYNVNTQRLGILPSQSSFQEFYLPTNTSYIVYEVERENGRFMVLAYRPGPRIAFRIIDCAYDRRYFVTDDGAVVAEWPLIAIRIGKGVFKSDRISTETGLLNILYGNHQDVDRALRRFSLVDSPQYTNLVASLQNIFLNRGLESGLIKDMLIASLDLSDISIDIDDYRKRFNAFKKSYDDILKWYDTDSRGNIKVRVDADSVLDESAMLAETEKQCALYVGMILFAIERDRKLIPIIEAKISELQADISRQNRLFDEEEAKKEKAKTELSEQMGALKTFFKQLKARRDYYAAIGIERIIELDDQKTSLEADLRTLEDRKRLLTDTNTGIVERYDRMKADCDTRLDREKANIAEAKIKVQNEFGERQKKAFSLYQSDLKDIVSRYEENRARITEALDSTREELRAIRSRLARLDIDNPHACEIADLQKQLMEFATEVKSRNADIKQIESAQDNLRELSDTRIKGIVAERDREVNNLEDELRKLQTALAELEGLYDNYDGSFGHWLEENVDGWTDNIGLVVADEVLHSHALNPNTSDCSQSSLYGVDIDLSGIQREIPSISVLKARIDAKKAEIDVLKKRILDTETQYNQTIESEQKKTRRQLADLENKRKEIMAAIMLAQTQEKNASQKLDDALRLRDEWHKAQTASIQADLSAKEREEAKAIESLKTLTDKYHKEKDNREKTHKKEISRLEDELKAQLNKLTERLSQLAEKIATEKDELEKQKLAELEKQGVDTKVLQDLTVKIEGIKAQIAKIESDHEQVVRWRADNEQYFSCEAEKSAEKKLIEKKLDELEDRFKERKQKHKQTIAKLQNDLDSHTTRRDHLLEALSKAKDYSLANDLAVVNPVGNEEPLDLLLDRLRDLHINKQEHTEKLRTAAKRFYDNFSPDNIFGFKLDGMTTESDIRCFARMVQDFIDNDKIETFRSQTNGQYDTLLKGLSHSIGDMQSNIKDVKRLVSHIVKDFEQNNFVGVINSFGLEVKDKDISDPIVNQMISLREFEAENSHNIGEVNLFSTESDTKETTDRAMQLLVRLIDLLDADPERRRITTADMFTLEMSYSEGGNTHTTRDKISVVGSTGTDVLLKAMVNIMLISVFKKRAEHGRSKTVLHCIMDEIGRLDPKNEGAIVKFANDRDIYVINSSPTTHNVKMYDKIYRMCRDKSNNVSARLIISETSRHGQ